MCGVCGFIVNGDEPRREMAGILSLQSCRGPDDRGFWTASPRVGLKVGLGHNRLSIIDLTSQGHQPMLSPDELTALSYNGEIYNYRELRPRLESAGWTFRSQSDTEVLLAAYALWGNEAWARLNGMFAVIVVDRRNSMVHLVRSRMGSKPLAYAQVEGGWIFGSTADALARVTRAGLSLDFVKQGMATWAYDGEYSGTPFVGVRQVLPGTIVSFSFDSPTAQPAVVRWYSLADAVASREPPPRSEAVAVVREALIQSVDLRLRSDVPVGVSLSGGLDSTSVAVLVAQRLAGPVNAFSYRWGPDDPESSDVATFAKRVGTSKLNLTWVDPPTQVDLPHVIQRTLVAQGAPISGLSVVAQNLVFAEARSKGAVVMLGGQGADEVFMGYRKFQLAHLRAQRHGGNFSGSVRTTLELGRTLFADRADRRSYQAAAMRYFLPDKSRGNNPLNAGRPVPAVPLGDPLSLSLADVAWNSLPTLLRFEDRNSMSVSIESRLPFLDYRLVELALSLPTDLKVRGGWGKWVLREAMSPWLPKSIAWNRSKRGFNAGDATWVELGVGKWLRARISDGVGGLTDIGVDRAAITGGFDFSDRRLAASQQNMHTALALAWMATWQQELAQPLPYAELPRDSGISH